MEQPHKQILPAGDSVIRILLLDDDGRMHRVLDEEKIPYAVTEAGALEGIALLGLGSGVYPGTVTSSAAENRHPPDVNPYDLVLLNAEHLGPKTVRAIKALRQVDKTVRLVLYGEGFAEVYAQPALHAGADDFLVWPIPRRELRAQTAPAAVLPPPPELNRQRIEQSKSDYPGFDEERNTRRSELLEVYQTLAVLIPQGRQALANQARKHLPKVLGRDWVSLRLDGVQADETAAQGMEPPGERIPLRGPEGNLGELILGPRRDEKNNIDPVEAAGFLGTLLYLAQRDAVLKRLALTDELTGAHNRRYLEHFLQQMIRQSGDGQTELTLLLFDIDEFKYYNDTYGHAAGDEILRQATQLIRRCCREHDVVARVGGDEFAVLFWDSGHQRKVYGRDGGGLADAKPHRGNSHSEMVMFLTNRFRRLMMTNAFPGLGPEARGMLTISGGVAAFPWDGRSVDELMQAADEALLQAKRSGKNRIYLVGQPQKKP